MPFIKFDQFVGPYNEIVNESHNTAGKTHTETQHDDSSLTTEAADSFKELNTNVFEIQDKEVFSNVLDTADALAGAIERDTETSKGVVLRALKGLKVKGSDIRSEDGEEIVQIKEFLPRDGKACTIVAKLKSGKFIKISLR